jgi:hypothetical protein
VTPPAARIASTWLGIHGFVQYRRSSEVSWTWVNGSESSVFTSRRYVPSHGASSDPMK